MNDIPEVTTEMVYAVWYALEKRGMLRDLAETGLQELLLDLEGDSDDLDAPSTWIRSLEDYE